MAPAELVIVYLAVPVVILAVVALLDRREFKSRAFEWVGPVEVAVLVGAALLWPLSAVVIAVSALLERRKRRRGRIRRAVVVTHYVCSECGLSYGSPESAEMCCGGLALEPLEEAPTDGPT